MYGYIYKTTNLINGKIYVGQHKGKFDKDYVGSGKILKLALTKYGKQNFLTELIDIGWDKDDLDAKEIFWIDFLKCQDYYIGYNLSGGGYPMNNYHHTDETKLKLSIYWTGYKRGSFSDEHKEHLSQSHVGHVPWNKGKHLTDEHKNNLSKSYDYDKHFTEETCRKISESNKGRKVTFETRLKLSNAHKGRKHTYRNGKCKYVLCVETSMIFDSLKEAKDWLGSGDIGACCRGTQETAGGYHWKYINKEDTEKCKKV